MFPATIQSSPAEISYVYSFNGLFSRTTWVSRCQKGKTSLDLNQAKHNEVLGCRCSGISWAICTQTAPYLQTDNYTNTSLIFLHAG